MNQPSGTGQLVVTFITFGIVLIPFLVFNIRLAKRKGQSVLAELKRLSEIVGGKSAPEAP